jgi:hypothetical protein
VVHPVVGPRPVEQAVGFLVGFKERLHTTS